MSESIEVSRCPRCGMECSSDEAARIGCPRCLIGLGLDHSVGGHDVFEHSEVGRTEQPPFEIGPYRVLETLGEGGMGVVYLAEQTEPIRRRVALKLIRLGMDTSRIISRFEVERQTLALMNHPNIAKVYDAGITRGGRPYFVMEYVPGIPLTEYCEKQRVELRDRLELFSQACDAIQHAHHKGIIHRDVKPSNVLVSLENERPTVKVIDFGVARAIDRRAGSALFTQEEIVVGTPAFMSPEQASGADEAVDTRSDVYSLGVLLYELLTGALPFDAASGEHELEELRRRIREQEPPIPSSRLEGKRLTRLRGDLDWITMKALEKDPARRYDSPAALFADIRRHLRREPVLAGPPGTAYRVSRFVRRHRVGVASASAVLAALIALVVTMTVQTARTARERDRANREAEAATLVSDFLVDLFEVSDPGEARGDSIPAREILDRGAARIEEDLADRPEVQARLMATMGEVYKKMGLYDQAEPLLERSRSLRLAGPGRDHPDTIESSLQIADLLFSQGKLVEAESTLRDALERSRRVLGEEHPHTLASMGDLAVVLHFQGRLEEAEAEYRDALEARGRHLGRDHEDTLETVNNMAALYYAQGRLDRAEPLLLRALEGRRIRFGDDHPETLDSLINLAAVLQTQGKLEQAEAYNREAVELGRRIRPDHPKTLVSINNLGMLLRSQGRLDEAESYCREALAMFRGSLGDEHPDTVTAMGNLGELYTLQGRLEEAEKLLVAAVETARRSLPGEDTVTGYTLRKYGRLLTRLRRFDDAERALLESHAVLAAAAGPDHGHTLKTAEFLVDLYEAWGKPEQAQRWR